MATAYEVMSAALEDMKLPRIGDLEPEGYVELFKDDAPIVQAHVYAAVEFARKGDSRGCSEQLRLAECALLRAATLGALSREVVANDELLKTAREAKEQSMTDLLREVIELVRSALPALCSPVKGLNQPALLVGMTPSERLYCGEDGTLYWRDPNGTRAVGVDEAAREWKLDVITRAFEDALMKDLGGARLKRAWEIGEEATQLRAIVTLMRAGIGGRGKK